jgi:hypothetical protein
VAPVAERSARPVAVDPRARLVFLFLMVVWLVAPFLLVGNVAQDAVPYVAAGRLVRTSPDDVYASRNGSLYDLRPGYAVAYCDAAPEGTDCPAVNVAFVSPPQALAVAVVAAALGDTGGVLLMRLGAAVALVAGMGILWRRMSTVSRQAGALLALTALLLTPMALTPLALGQTSPLMFLSVVVGIDRSARWRGAFGSGLLWLLTVVLKVFPAVLVLVLVARRRWRMLAVAAGGFTVLSVAAVALGPVHLFGDFVRTSVDLNRSAADNPYNGGLDALVHPWAPTLTQGAAGEVGLVVRAAAAVALFWWAARDADDDTAWAYGWLLSLLVVPLLWWHYLWVVIASLAMIVTSRREPARWIAVLPVAAVVSLPIALIQGRDGSLPVGQAIVFLAGLAAATWLLRRPAVGAVAGRHEVPSGAPSDGA